jgi:hypothetical protein
VKVSASAKKAAEIYVLQQLKLLVTYKLVCWISGELVMQ